MQAARGLGRITIAKELMTNKISLVITRPFKTITNATATKDAAKREAMVKQTELFDTRAGDAFKDMNARITTGFHISRTDPEDHLTVELRDSNNQPGFWYQISRYDYWENVHVHEKEELIKHNDYVRISKDMADVGRPYREKKGKADTYWHNAKTKHLVEWKVNEAAIPHSLLMDYADWKPIDHATFNAEKGKGATVVA